MNDQSPALISARAGALAFSLFVVAAVCPAQFLRMPQPGDVFRDYGRTMNGNRDWRVTDPNATAAGAAESLPNPILALSVADLQGATRAELIIDFWGGHPGTQPRQFRFNNNAWITIPNLATVPTPRPNCFMQQVNFVVDIPLADLVEGTNTLEGTSGGQICNNFNWGQWGWYQVILRVYYDAATKPHATGAITSPLAGNTFGENPTVTASASGGTGVARVDFFAYFDGYDPDGDGRYADWQVSYHRPLSATTPWMSEHIGSDSTAPFAVTWDTALVPDQRPSQVKLVAHIRDGNGYVFVTDEVASLTLKRTTTSVRLYRGVGVPEVFWLRNNQTGSSYFVIPRKDDLANASSAFLLLRTWNARQSLTTMLVNSWIAPLLGQDHHYSYDRPALPVSALLSGLNTFTASSTETEHHGTEIMWPGPALLVRYNTSPRLPTQMPAFFGFDELSGDTVVDASGNDNDGVIVSPGVTRTDSGRFGRGIQFDGTTGAVDLDVIEFPGSALTVSLWAYVGGTSATDARLFAKALSAQTLDGYCVVSLQDQTRIRFRLATENGVRDLVSGSVLTLDAWNHVAVTYDGASMRIYVNGVQRASTAHSGAIVNGSNVPAWLGDNPGPERRRFTGRLDELRLFNTAQTATDITALMNTAVADSDTTPPGAPTNLAAAALSSYSVALSWTAPSADADVSFYRVFRDGLEIGTTTTTSYRDRGLAPLTAYTYTVRAADTASNLSTPSAPASATTLASSPPSDAPWWNTAWPYRTHLRTGSADWPRSDRMVDLTVNLTELLAAAGATATVDVTTLRLVEVAVDGRILDSAVPFQFDPAPGFDPTTNARGTLVFRLTGATPAGLDRHYHLYFAPTGGDATPLTLTPEVVVTDGVTDEGQSSFRVATPTGTYFYHKLGGGFSSWLDTEGNDWIGYHPTGGSAGNYRGIPNAVHPEGHFHPGATTSQSTLIHSGPLKTTLHSITTDGLWECTWEIYGRNARLTMIRAAANFWFLYEGTPGGTLQPTSDLVIRSSGAISLASQSWTEDLAGDEWVSFADPGLGRSLYAALHQADTATDSYWPMEARMTVFGFGRNNLTSYLSGTPKTFTIGLVDSVDFGSLSLEIASASKDVITVVTRLEALAAPPLVSDDFRTGHLDTDRWTLIDPAGDGGGSIVDQRLALSVPAGSDHDLWTSGIRAPHAIQTVGNTDFEIEAKFESTPSLQYQMQGFVALQDGANFLRFEVHSDGTGVYAFAATLAGATASTKARIAIASLPTYYLRLGRTGNVWTFSYSPDGNAWTNAATFSHALTLTKLGVFAGNSGGTAAPAFTALVDYVFNTASPIVPEDSQGTIATTVTGEGTVTKAPDQPLYDVGQVVQLTALAAPGWLFNQWNGAVSGAENPVALTVTGNHGVTAEFIPEANTAPTISSIAAQTTQEDVSIASIPFTVGDTETEAAALVVTGLSSDPSLMPDANITFGGTGADRTLTLTPLADRFGTATITVSVSDGRLTTSTTFALTVDPVNDAPTLSPLADRTIVTGGNTGPLAVTLGDDITPADELVLTGTSLNQLLVPDSGITFGGAGPDRTVTVTPVAGQAGNATIVVTVSDGELTAERSFVLTVTSAPAAFVSDDFSAPALATALWTFVNPVGDGSFELIDQTLRIHVPGGVDHDIWTSGNRAPRLMQSVADTDFEVEAKFESAGTKKYQFQGFIVQQDAANFLRIEVLHDGSKVRAFVASFVDGAPTALLNKTITAAATYHLRVARTGSQWTYRYSYDGLTWTTAGTFFRALTVTEIGLHAGNSSGSSSPAFTSILDYAFNTASPVDPEDAPIENTPPSITSLDDLTIAEDSTVGPLAFTIGDAETSADALILTASSANTALVPDSNVVFSGIGADRTVTVTPLLDQTGSATISVTAGDGELTTTERFVLTVDPVNDSPSISMIADQTIMQDGSTGPLAFSIADVENPPDVLTLTAATSDPTLVPADHIVFDGTAADRTVTVTPATGQSGTALVSVTVSDGELSDSTTFQLTVTALTPGNTAPTLGSLADQAIDEDTATGPLAFTIDDEQTPADDLLVTASSSNPALIPESGIALGGSGANRTLTVTPLPDEAGTSTISVSVSDGELSSTVSFLLTVTPVNDSPSISAIADQAIAQDTDTGPIPFNIGDPETPADSLVLSGASSDPTLAPVENIAFNGSGADRTVTVTPAAGQSGTAFITITVSDGELSADQSFLLSVSANTAPTVTTLSDQAIDEDSIAGPLTFTIGDAETPLDNLLLVGSSSNPALVPDDNLVFGGSGADRTLTVTPLPDEAGTTTITVSVSDGALTANTSFALTVAPVNDAPTLSAIADQTIVAGTSMPPIPLTIDDKETPVGELVLTASSSNPSLLTDANLAFAGSGENRSLLAKPTTGQSGRTTVTVTVSDGELTAERSFVLTVTSAPAAFVSDDFSAPALDTALWTFVNPVGDGSFELIDQTLRIHVPGGVDHDIWTSGNRAPRLMQSVADTDFEVAAKFESAVMKKYQFQGFIVQQDAANFLRIEVLHDGSKVRAFVASFVDGAPTALLNKTITAAATYHLRIARAGSQWTYRYSYDGLTWTTAGTFSRTLTVTEIGVHAGNSSGSSSPAFTAIVDYAFNTASPFDPEDPSAGTLTTGVNGDGTVSTSPEQSSYGFGEIVTLTAAPASGWRFDGWGGDADGTTNPLEFPIAGDHTVMALFTQETQGNTAAPTISEIADQTIDEDTPLVALSFGVADEDTSAAQLVVTGTSSDAGLVPDPNIVFGGTGSERTVTVTPAANQSGTTTIALTVSDGELTSSASFVLTVSPVNDPPTISSIADQTIEMDTATEPLSFSIGDVDTPLTNLTLSGQSSDTRLIPDANVTFAGSDADWTVTVTPLAGQTGSATITLTVSDGALSATESFVVLVEDPTGAFVSDDFSGGTLDPGRWSFQNPLGDATAAVDGTLLRIDVPGGTSHDAWKPLNAPRVIQAIADTDFGIEVKFLSLVQQKYQIQGILIEQDSDDFLRYDVHHDGLGVRLFAVAFTNGSASVKLNTSIATGPAYFLRVDRAGDQWTLSYSYDGFDWLTGATFTHGMTAATAGVFAGNSGSGINVPGFTVFADYAFNTAAPIIPEDDGRASIVIDLIGDGTVTRTPDEAAYELGATVELHATPGDGSAFVGWRGDIGDIANPATVLVDDDIVGTATFGLPDTASSVLGVWYGDTQTFGQPGVPQQWVNVLGNLVAPAEVAELSYYLNGAYQGRLSIGPAESYRLVEAGDFNAEIDYTHLASGANQVMFVAERFDGTVIVKATTVNFAAGNTWPLPYAIDWSTPALIQDVAQITDGRWSFVSGGVRTTVRGYDRVLAFGDMMWTNYEVTVPFTVHSVNSNQYGACVGVVTRWIGHFDWDGSQPRWGWYPNGAIGGIMWRSNSNTPLIELQPSGLASDQSLPIALSFGTRYQLKMQVETQGTPDAPSYVHRLKLWRDGDPEPVSWTLTRTASSGLDAGSALLLAHNVDVTFGDVSVQPLTP